MTKAYDYIQNKVKSSNIMFVEKSAAISNADELRKFNQLLDEGIITDEEFQKKKKELLNL